MRFGIFVRSVEDGLEPSQTYHEVNKRLLLLQPVFLPASKQSNFQLILFITHLFCEHFLAAQILRVLGGIDTIPLEYPKNLFWLRNILINNFYEPFYALSSNCLLLQCRSPYNEICFRKSCDSIRYVIRVLTRPVSLGQFL